MEDSSNICSTWQDLKINVVTKKLIQNDTHERCWQQDKHTAGKRWRQQYRICSFYAKLFEI